MNLSFSMSTLTIITMTLFIGFYIKESTEVDYDWEELEVLVYTNDEIENDEIENDKIETCSGDLKKAGFDVSDIGYKTLKAIIPDMQYEVEETSPDFAKSKVKDQINEAYEKINKENRRAIAYYSHLVLHIFKKENMLTVPTWCRIYGNGTYYMSDFLNDVTPKQKYLKRIANNTGLTKKEQTIIYRSIDVCYYEIQNNIPNSYFFKLYRSLQSLRPNYAKILPFTWCAINACYDSLIIAGFLDDKPSENIERVIPKLNINTMDENSYAYKFLQHLESLRVYKQPQDDYITVTPYNKDLDFACGYLRNWCTTQVCHDDLVEEGYIFETYYDNNYNVTPRRNMNSMRNDENILYQFADEYRITLRAYEHVDKNSTVKGPLEWCKFLNMPIPKKNNHNENHGIIEIN